MKRSTTDFRYDDIDDNDDDQHFEMYSSIEFERIQRTFPDKVMPILLECRVCGAPAHGYNFDQITCESCKAFFRRNALRDTSHLKCRFSGCCPITVESRRQCTYCRLKKCFDVKMKKEWIRTDEERHLRALKRFYKQRKDLEKHAQITVVERKKNRLQPLLVPSKQLNQQRLSIIQRPIAKPISKLSDMEVLIVNNINHSYEEWALNCDTEHIKHYSLETSTLMDFLNDENDMYRSLVDFYKQIPEFRRIHLEDQILLIKCNMTHIIHCHHVLKDRFLEDSHIGKLMSKWVGVSFHNKMSQTRHFYDYFEKNPIILKLAFVVMIFTINLSRLPPGELFGELLEKNLIVQIQHFYVTLLWKYINDKFDEKTSVQSMSLIVFQFLRYQRLMHQMELFIIEQIQANQLHPLMKSVLRLS